jgi:FkbM family methyltransferase
MTLTNLEFTEKLFDHRSATHPNRARSLSDERSPEVTLMDRAIGSFKSRMQSMLIASLRPYISAELPGWNLLYRVAIGRRTRDRFWSNAQARFSRTKFHPFGMRFHLSDWADREAFFFRRWHELAVSIFLRDVIRQGDTVVDIGAARGMFTMLAAYLTGAAGKVISFEPNPISRSLMERDLNANAVRHVRIIDKGASSRAERKQLVVPRLDRQAATFGALPENQLIYYRLEADLAPADNMLSSESPVLIKISTEGYETEAIRGLSETIKRCHPVFITDISERRLPACGSSVGELMKLMSDMGYLGFKIELSKNSETARWSVRPLSPKDLEMKAVWVHANSPTDARELILARMTEG